MASYLEDRGILTAGERNSPQTELLGRVEHHGLKRRNMSTLYGKPASQTRTLVDAAAQRWVLIDEDKKPVEKLLRYHNGRLPQRPSTVDFWPTTSQDSVTATSSLRPPPVPVSHPLRNNSSGVPPSPLAPVARSRLELPTPNALLKDHCNISHRVEAILGSSNAVTTTSARPHLPHVAQGNSSETQPMSMHLPPILHTPNSTLRQVSCLNPTIQPPNKQTSTRVPAIPLPTPPPATPPTPIIPYHSDPAVNLLPINFAQARACPLECPPSEFRPINPGPTANVTRNDPSVLSGPLSSSYYFIHRRPSISTPVQAPPWLNERSIGRSSVQDQKASQPTIERLAAHPSALSPRTSVPASQVLPVSVPPDFPPSMSTSQHFPDRMYRPPVEHQRTYSSLNYRGPSFMTPSHSPSKVPPVDRSSAFTSINQQAPADHTLGKESMTRPPSSARSWTNGSHTVPTTLDEGSQNEEFLTGQAQTEGPWYFRSETGCVTCKRQRIECGEKNPYCRH
ncbi:hypothetical protein BU16DRAFT_89553 [Lophium mytilinum]|uniref:Zn(2)-C6 fungal-type domain-containing protein n=1 Tax=Lophium mytilinum TaxID=390894 RepID=A0A6A6QKE9_9PEZI|nr:hypothetical protein BU16DRAFT_89553 [Lophium mytilinum]